MTEEITHAALHNEMQGIRARLDAGTGMFAEVKVMIAEVKVGLAHMEQRHSAQAEEIKKLVVAEARRDGERGVLAAVLRSPFIAWLAALVAALWASIKLGGPNQ